MTVPRFPSCVLITRPRLVWFAVLPLTLAVAVGVLAPARAAVGGAELGQLPLAAARAIRANKALNSDLEVIDASRLDGDEQERYDEAIALKREALRLIKEDGVAKDLEVATLLERAEGLLAPLVSRALGLESYLALLEQYRQTRSIGSQSAGPDEVRQRWSSLITYVEQNRDRLGVPRSSLEMFTPKTAATAVVFQTEVAFTASYESGLLLATDRLLQVLEDASLVSGFRKTWHLAVAAHLQGRMELVRALEHAERSLERFPHDPDILIAAGALDELLASRHFSPSTPWLQVGFVQKADVARNTALLNRGRRDGLKRAEKMYRTALVVYPASAEAGLRLGRVLFLLGRPEAALVVLGDVSKRSGDSRIRYLGSLFAGAIHGAASRWPQAIEAYREAAATGPFLSAGIALSQALHASGDRDGAQEALDRALERDSRNERSDPWWDYPLGHWRQRHELIRQLREMIQ